MKYIQTLSGCEEHRLPLIFWVFEFNQSMTGTCTSQTGWVTAEYRHLWRESGRTPANCVTSRILQGKAKERPQARIKPKICGGWMLKARCRRNGLTPWAMCVSWALRARENGWQALEGNVPKLQINSEFCCRVVVVHRGKWTGVLHPTGDVEHAPAPAEQRAFSQSLALGHRQGWTKAGARAKF